MITKIEVSQEDFEAAITVFDIYDDGEQRFDATLTVICAKGNISVRHHGGILEIDPNGVIDDYGKDLVRQSVRIFKQIYPHWKEY